MTIKCMLLDHINKYTVCILITTCNIILVQRRGYIIVQMTEQVLLLSTELPLNTIVFKYLILSYQFHT